ncbi:alpha-L-fucosidase [Sphingomonas sp. BK580]|uniref:alpha-L-fucosidase n=1 Tax=Sphingomonas sp. BK580 TaxID=2586972 RepID=UPI00161FB526|nr:alpha-L-fucosidase [Sphingomonas sp. BK580]MBB3694624.1 alpha-L-fucosidase [Sphingomonas sp. BK580]
MAGCSRRVGAIVAWAIVATLASPIGASAQSSPAQQPASPADASSYTPAAANLAARTWFQDAKFGVFLHWGLYSELGGSGSPGLAEWIMQENKIPAAKYERLAHFFNPTRFDADAWVRSFKDAGARYIVITSKHHDGFAMFGSKVSRYNVVDATPFKRDPIAELAAACRRQGVKLFFYYSQLDWHNPDYFPRGRTGHTTGRPEAGDWERYVDYQDAQLRELLTQYGPIGGIWFDGWWDQEKTALRDRWRLDRTYALIHSLQPAALIVNNHHRAPFPGEDYQTFERDLPGENTMGFNGDKATIGRLPLEMAETMNGSWGFNLVDDNYKSPETLVRTMVGAAGRNANFLLNTGPMPNGEIQPENLVTFHAIGEWMKRHAESIYGTRGGPVAPGDYGVTTQRGDTVYVHLLRAHDGRVRLPLAAKVRSARLLDGGAAVTVTARGGAVELAGLPPLADAWDQVVALQLRR